MTKQLFVVGALLLCFLGAAVAGTTTQCIASHFSGHSASCEPSRASCDGVKVYNLCGDGETCCVQKENECPGSCKKTSKSAGETCSLSDPSRVYVKMKCPGGSNVMCCPHGQQKSLVQKLKHKGKKWMKTITDYLTPDEATRNNRDRNNSNSNSNAYDPVYGRCIGKTAEETKNGKFIGICMSYVKATLCRVLQRTRKIWPANLVATKPINPKANSAGRKTKANNPHYIQCNSNTGLTGALAGQVRGKAFADWADANPALLRSVFGMVKYTGDAKKAPVGTVNVYDPRECGYHSNYGHMEIVVRDNWACSDGCGRIRPRKEKQSEVGCRPRQYLPVDSSVMDSEWCESR